MSSLPLKLTKPPLRYPKPLYQPFVVKQFHFFKNGHFSILTQWIIFRYQSLGFRRPECIPLLYWNFYPKLNFIQSILKKWPLDGQNKDFIFKNWPAYHYISQNPAFLSFLESSWDFNFIFLFENDFFSFLTQRTIFILRFNSMTICELGGMTLLTVTLTMNTTLKMSDLNWSEIKFENWSRGNDVIIIFGAKKWPALHSLLKNAQFRAQIRLTSIY